jgi:hypothetical protein
VKKAKSTNGGEYYECICPDPAIGKLYSKMKAEEHGYAGMNK